VSHRTACKSERRPIDAGVCCCHPSAPWLPVFHRHAPAVGTRACPSDTSDGSYHENLSR
jgi:hypothetical protein